jgi:dTDP-4-amino-4,6-dideoxygalactose transaminase
MLKNTEKFAEEVLSVPMYPTLAKSEVEYVSDKIGEFFKGNK